MNYIDEAVGDSPALIICEDQKMVRLHASNFDFSEKTHFITTETYLRKLEQEHIVSSFDTVWKQILGADYS